MLKQAVVIVAAAAKKRAVLSKRADAAVPNLSSKRPHQEVEPVCEAPRPPKRVKKLPQKRKREIHSVSSKTTEATTPDAPPALLPQDLLEQQPSSTVPTSQVPPVLETVEPVAASTTPETVDPSAVSLGGEPAALVQPAVPVLEAVVERQSPQNPK